MGFVALAVAFVALIFGLRGYFLSQASRTRRAMAEVAGARGLTMVADRGLEPGSAAGAAGGLPLRIGSTANRVTYGKGVVRTTWVTVDGTSLGLEGLAMWSRDGRSRRPHHLVDVIATRDAALDRRFGVETDAAGLAAHLGPAARDLLRDLPRADYVHLRRGLLTIGRETYVTRAADLDAMVARALALVRALTPRGDAP